MAPPPSPTPPSAGNAERADGPGGELQKLRAISGGLRELAATDWSAAVSGSARDLVRELEQIMRTTTAIQADVLAAAGTGAAAQNTARSCGPGRCRRKTQEVSSGQKAGRGLILAHVNSSFFATNAGIRRRYR